MSSKEYHRNYNKARYHIKRERYILTLGGKCKHCGSTIDLQFDHIDPATKTFGIGECLTYSEAKVLDELKKCQLLCIDCHTEKTRQFEDGYTNRAKGARIATSKLTEEDVRNILSRVGTETNSSLAIEFGVDQTAISQIKLRKNWKHIDFNSAEPEQGAWA